MHPNRADHRNPAKLIRLQLCVVLRLQRPPGPDSVHSSVTCTATEPHVRNRPRSRHMTHLWHALCTSADARCPTEPHSTALKITNSTKWKHWKQNLLLRSERLFPSVFHTLRNELSSCLWLFLVLDLWTNYKLLFYPKTLLFWFRRWFYNLVIFILFLTFVFSSCFIFKKCSI